MSMYVATAVAIAFDERFVRIVCSASCVVPVLTMKTVAVVATVIFRLNTEKFAYTILLSRLLAMDSESSVVFADCVIVTVKVTE